MDCARPLKNTSRNLDFYNFKDKKEDTKFIESKGVRPIVDQEARVV